MVIQRKLRLIRMENLPQYSNVQSDGVFERASNERVVVSEIIFTIFRVDVVTDTLHDRFEIGDACIRVRAETNLKHGIQCIKCEISNCLYKGQH